MVTVNKFVQYSGSFAVEVLKYFKTQVQISGKKFKMAFYKRLDFIKGSLNKIQKRIAIYGKQSHINSNFPIL